MKSTDILQRYEGHPLKAAFNNLDTAQNIETLYRMFIAAKTMLMLLEHQGELTKEEADCLEAHVQSRVDLYQPGNQQEKFS